jgi:arsenite oxidase large subunit
MGNALASRFIRLVWGRTPDLVEVSNDSGSTQAMVWPTPTARRKETFMLFAYPTVAVGNVVDKGVNELIIPNYKQTWGNIRKLADAPQATRHLSFKSQEYPAPSS